MARGDQTPANAPGPVAGSAAALAAAGLARHEAGDRAAAATLYRAALQRDPDQPDALHGLGLMAWQAGDATAAIARLERALALRPDAAAIHNSLGNALVGAGRVPEALVRYRAAARLRPGSPEILSNLGSALLALDRTPEAIAALRAAVALAPGSAVLAANLGLALHRLGALGEAAACLRRAALQDHDAAEIRFRLGTVLLDAGDAGGAEAALRAALDRRPDYPEAINNLACALQALGRLGEAEAWHRDALRLRPDDAEAHYNLGCALLAADRGAAARACYDRALALRPDHGAARLARVMAGLPRVPDDAAAAARGRRAYAAALAALARDAGRTPLAGLADAVGASQPFHLASLGAGPERVLQARYGRLVCGAIAAVRRPPPLPPPAAPGEPVRLAIVSGCFHDHTVWRLFLHGWLARLDRRRFAITAYHTGSLSDAVTETAATLAPRFVGGRRPPAAWRELIRRDAPHVILHPEIGMDPVAAQLAAERLAPVQCVAWGHPLTSGLPTVDWFLGSDLMEPSGAAAHYTERLLRLPNLGIWVEPAPSPAPGGPGRAALGLRDGAVVFWSGQALHKYHPAHERLLARIARGAGDCQIVFIADARSDAVTDRLRARLAAAFAAEGLDAAAHCVFLPPLTRPGFVAAAALCDVVLDTPGWSGGLSTLDLLAAARPIVTWRGGVLRARHTAAVLTRIGVPQTIADDADSYVALALRLARDPRRRAALGRRVAAGRARAFRDETAIAALSDALERLGRGLSPGGKVG